MSESLTSAARRDLRKELVRLRLEMHRQQLLYNAQPLTHPLQQFRQMRQGDPSNVKTPLMVGAGVLLTLFGGRLGTFGKVARAALMLYPVVRGVKAVKKPSVEHYHR
ncbi:MAG TPA: hypothetical protein VLF16_14410 [Pseudomonas sp.]|nr:hypothetical protein [Pseudomonas sp.]